MHLLSRLLILALVAGLTACSASRGRAQSERPASSEARRGASEKINSALLSHLDRFDEISRTAGTDSALSMVRHLDSRLVRTNDDGAFFVRIRVTEVKAETEAALAGKGALIVNRAPDLSVYEAWVAPEHLRQVAALSPVISIKPIGRPVTRSR